jgi:uncharacterized surface protein with fasciclin (FAS1) repeats
MVYRKLKTLFAVASLVCLAACGGGGGDDEVAQPAPLSTKNVVQIAQADPKFSTLVEAIAAADLGSTLSGVGPFTVFAPTNSAFDALLIDLNVTKPDLLANKALLTSILTYHVLPSKTLKANVPLGKPLVTVQGAIFKADTVGGAIVITDGRNREAKVIATDIAATNGVVHAVDTVLLPPDKTVMETLQEDPNLSVLVEALGAADLVATLNGAGPYTVFAPTNAAFTSLLAELGESKAQLLANKVLLNKVLTYHVVAGNVLKADVPVGTPVATLETETFTVDADLVITDQRARKANIIFTDVLNRNGVIHEVDKVILPK